MKNSSARLLIGLGILGIVFTGLTVLQTWRWSLEQVDTLSHEQTVLLIDVNNSIRKYIKEHIRPEMAKRIPRGEFVPEAMSTSFVARSILDQFRQKHPDYILRFPSVNPRNPVNKADARELSIIRYFQRNPGKKFWAGSLDVDGKNYYARATPRRLEAECLQCHGNPSDAPASLVRRYGSTAGFGKHVGDLSIDLVAMPRDSVYSAAAALARRRALWGIIPCLVFVAAVVFLIRTDTRQRKRSESAVNSSERRYRSLWESAIEGFCLHEVVLDEQGEPIDYRILDVNPAYENTLGLKAKDVVGRLATDVYGIQCPPYLEVYSRVASTGVPESFETYFEPMDLYFDVAVFSPAPGRFATAFANISERKAHEQQLSYQSNHDSLTGLPNRYHFEHYLRSQTALRCDGKPLPFTPVFLDLDRFKLINDALGHYVGDKVLIKTAERLMQCVRSSDLVARLGGDEFAVILNGCDQRDVGENVARQLIDSISRPFDVEGHRLVVGASAGLAMHPMDAEDGTTLLRHADAAMYTAKHVAPNTYRWYSGEVDRRNRARMQIGIDIRRAIEEDQFQIFYQPILSLKDGAIRGAEALLRWNHPENGMVSPGLFIPVAEDMGLMGVIGARVLRSACSQMKEWIDSGVQLSTISVNVSTAQVRESGWLISLGEAVSESRLDPTCINLELTESDFAVDFESLRSALEEAFDIGVKLSIDDFGMGQSSLSRLKDLPMAQLKIDGSFVKDIEHNQSDKELLRSIVLMAHSQGIEVTAEWVETKGQLDILQSYDCDLAQGYFISPPLPADEFREFVTRYESTRAWRRRAA
jgi:diguanylate cyclase (GGDEF)-like protein